MSAKIYRFESKAERLKRAHALATDVELLLTEGERAVPYLLTGLRDGDHDLQLSCVIALVSWHKEAALEPFYQLMADSAQDADLRDHLAISLSVIGGSRGFPEWLMERLITDLESPDPTLRGLAAIALGWEANTEAIVPLLPRLFDPDAQVRSQAAVALAEVEDPRVLELLLDRLEHSEGEERIGLMLNLHCFQDERAFQAILAQLDYPNAEVRFHALPYLCAFFADRSEINEGCLRLLNDPDLRIRQLAAKELGRRRVASAERPLQAMLEEADMKTRRVVLVALQQIRGERPVSEWD
jgi:HEAT repeat protein